MAHWLATCSLEREEHNLSFAISNNLLELDSSSLMFQLHDTSLVEIEFVTEFEEHLEMPQLSQTDVFLAPHDYEQFLLNQEFDTPLDNPNHAESHTCENLCQDDPFFTHATNLGSQFTLPHSMAQHNYDDLEPTDNASTDPTFTKADNGHELNPVCAHNPFASQVDPNKCFNSLVSPWPHSGEHFLKLSADDIRAKDYPVNWFKFISSTHSKTSITESSIPGPTPVHVAYSPLTSKNHL